jgi:glycerate 2-kinase
MTPSYKHFAPNGAEFTMPNLTQLRLAAREIFNEALRAIDPGAAVRRAVRLEDAHLSVCGTVIDLSTQRPVYAIAIGKAAFAMASALDEVLAGRLTDGVLTSNALGYATPTRRGCERVDACGDAGGPQAGMPALPGWRAFQGGHPEPNEQSLSAAQAGFDLLKRADKEGALVIFLISGGGSAMIEWPIGADITLADLRAANKALVKCGASIGEINAVRRAFSAVKGGRLADLAPHCDQMSLIVSDVPRGEEANVASGPTLAPPNDAPDARAVIARYDLRSRFPETILRAIDAAPSASLPSDSTSLRKHFVLLDNHSALETAAEAARRLGFVTEIADDISDQPIAAGCSDLLRQLGRLRERARAEPNPNAVCLISGGEFACPVRGDGIGGRNLETALRLSMSPGLLNSEPFVALCAGTDGTDGNSPAAGAIVDSTTMERARAIGLDPQDSLNRSDAYSFFVALGDVIATGPTGTNVRDIRILLHSR